MTGSWIKMTPPGRPGFNRAEQERTLASLRRHLDADPPAALLIAIIRDGFVAFESAGFTAEDFVVLLGTLIEDFHDYCETNAPKSGIAGTARAWFDVWQGRLPDPGFFSDRGDGPS